VDVVQPQISPPIAGAAAGADAVRSEAERAAAVRGIAKRLWALAAFAAIVPGAAPAAVPAQADDLVRFDALYKELVETNTTLSQGSCTEAAVKMRARLIAAGFAASEARIVVAPEFPKQGNLVARLEGADAKAPPILLLAHIDVVEAKAADWTRDPFRLVEEGGYFHARGAIDDKAMAASFVDLMIRFREAGFKPRRTIKLALTCGEETDAVFNGVQYLLRTEPDSLRAGFAINEGGKGFLDESGLPRIFGVQTGEKIYQDFRLTVRNPGGHSSRPVRDNAIVRLSAAMVRLGGFAFPADIGEVTRGFFGRSARQYSGQVRADMESIGAGRADDAAVARLAEANPIWNAMVRTTCVPTLLNAGHAANALPQRAEAIVNCRILPGQTIAQVHAILRDVVSDPQVDVALADPPGPIPPAPSLTAEIMQPVEALVGEMWPGVPVVPSISTGATDGRFLNAAGIATYGVSGIFVDPDGNGVHGLNERVRVKSLHDGRTFLYRLVRIYAGQGK
jgi:acetylornithine deacetylase/succinyl-diaminopimelate desuccinylase-like protein